MPPENGFFATLGGDLHQDRKGLVMALVCIAILIAIPKLFPARDRVHHHRFSIGCLLLFILMVFVHATISGMDVHNWHQYIEIPESMLLAIGVIGASAMLLFDVVGRSLIRLRIMRDIASVAAAIVVLLGLLHKQGVNLSGLIATSAVLGGVLGFALQETLGNVIGGIALQIESTMAPGDWVTIGDISGQVTEIRWRSTTITTRNDDMVVIPNGLLAKGQIINLSRPVPWHRQWVHFDVHYRHPPNEVQRVVLEAVRGVPNVKQEDPAPDCIFYRAEQDHAHYALRYRLLDLRADDGTDSEVKKRIWYALRRKGIEIPYPSRNVFLTEMTPEREHEKFRLECSYRAEALRGVEIFKPLTKADFELLADRLRVEVFGVGETIIHQGDAGDSLYLVRAGSVSVRVMVDHIQREVAALGPGQIFGEMSLMTGESRKATVVAKDDVECYVIDRALFQEVIGQRVDLVHEISQILARRDAELKEDLSQLDAEAQRAREAARAHDLVARIKAFFLPVESPPQ